MAHPAWQQVFEVSPWGVSAGDFAGLPTLAKARDTPRAFSLGELMSWIKMRNNLWDDPRISKLCDLTDQGEAPIIGALYWLWAMADEHTEDGLLQGLTPRQIDRKTGVPGFADALAEVGWIIDHGGSMEIIRFEEHNGSSAKRRATEAQRKANGRTVSAPDADKQRTDNGQKPPDCGAREDKRREDISSSLRSEDTPPEKPEKRSVRIEKPVDVSQAVWDSFKSVRKTKKAAITDLAILGIRREAVKSGLTLEQALTVCCEMSWAGFKSEWYEKDRQRATPQRQQPKSFAQQEREAGWARWEQQTNQIHPDRIAAQQGHVIDITPQRTLEIEQ